MTLESKSPDSMSLDPHLMTLAAERNIGAIAIVKADGRPLLSPVNFTFDPTAKMARISVIDGRAKVSNLRRDPRASIFVTTADGWTFAVLEGSVELSPVALTPDDDTVEELIDIFRAIRGEDHPDWDEYRAKMVVEGRMVARLHLESIYGLVRPE